MSEMPSSGHTGGACALVKLSVENSVYSLKEVGASVMVIFSPLS